ncbi:unnamed protein product [Chrysoparadoxa australica]
MVWTLPSVKHNETYNEILTYVESFSSVFFLCEYAARLAVCHERKRYRGWRGHLRYVLKFQSLVDLASFLPWLATFVGGPELPPTAFIRSLRILRILKTERFIGSFDSVKRVIVHNAEILGVALTMASILMGFTATLLFYLGPAQGASSDADFSSVPATLYLSVLMLTGQGEPDGVLPWFTKLVCAGTALFSVAMVAIPSSMLTWGFENEAQRLLKKKRERRLRRTMLKSAGWLDNEIDSGSSSSSSGSEDDGSDGCLSSSDEEYEDIILGPSAESKREMLTSKSWDFFKKYKEDQGERGKKFASLVQELAEAEVAHGERQKSSSLEREQQGEKLSQMQSQLEQQGRQLDHLTELVTRLEKVAAVMVETKQG